MTSMAMAEGIQRRLASASEALAAVPPAFRITWSDAGLIAVIVAAVVLSITGTYGRKWLRRSFQILVIVYVGFLTGGFRRSAKDNVRKDAQCVEGRLRFRHSRWQERHRRRGQCQGGRPSPPSCAARQGD